MIKLKARYALPLAALAIAVAVTPSIASANVITRHPASKRVPILRPRPDRMPFTSEVDALGTSKFTSVYGGLSLSRSRSPIIYVVRSGDSAFLSTLQNLAHQGHVTAYKVVPVSRSWAQLNSLTMRIARASKYLRSKEVILAQWGPDAPSNKVTIALRKVTKAADRLLYRLYGDSWIEISPHPFKTVFYYRDRFSDTAPYYGGDPIWPSGDGPQTFCTSGFPLVDANAEYFMTTADHCGATTWYTNYLNPQPIGSTYGQYQESSMVDVQTFTAQTLGLVWGDSDNTFTITGTYAPNVGDEISFDGAYSGLQTDVPVTRTGPFCEEIDLEDSCDLGEAVRSSGDPICLGGDSGGPVFIRRTSPNINAIGIVTASDNTGLECLYTRIQAIQHVAGATVVLGG